MPDAIDFRRLRYTPLRDALRGRLTGSLDWRARLVAANLSTPIAALIETVVRRTRLWNVERNTVADELIAHFADGLAGGETADALVHDFGDARAAARLIRRAMVRKRTLAWHAFKWARRALGVLVAVYAVVFARFWFSRPTVSVDYLAQLNAPIVATPEVDRGWPLYRRAFVALDLGDEQAGRPKNRTHPLDVPLPDAEQRFDGDDRQLIDATPADTTSWPLLAAWLDAHADGLGLLRQAAAKPRLGFVLGPNGSQDDPALGWQFRKPSSDLIDQSLIGVLLPSLNGMRQVARILVADARVAGARGDGVRLTSDLAAIIGIAGQHRELPLLINDLVGMGIASLGCDAIERALADGNATAMSEVQLVGLAHRLATYGGDAPASLIDLSGERMMFEDIVQRTYSDDGYGDGHLTADGARAMPRIMGTRAAGDERVQAIARVALGGAMSSFDSRRDLLAEYKRLIELLAAPLARPLRETKGIDTERQVDRRFAEIAASSWLTAKYLPLRFMMPSFNGVGATAERTLGRREGVTVGIALELYRRRHGDWPPTLDALVPEMLPRVPADRITGEPIRYRVIDGQPVVYSVGADRDDDGGRAVVDKRNVPQPWAAAEWQRDGDAVAKNGDWILFDGRASH